MRYEHRGRRPRVHASAFVSPHARLYGEVDVGPGTAVLAGAVLTAEGGAVTLGAHCVIMEGAVLRGVPGNPCRLEDHVLVGPGAHLAGCHVEELAFLATGATVLNGARIGRVGEVRINAVVHTGSRLPDEGMVPIGWLAVGDPAEIHSPSAHDRIWAVQRTLGFRERAFRMGDLPRERFMRQMTRRYARALGRHKNDVLLGSLQTGALPGPESSTSPWSVLASRLWGRGEG